jgi:hypothetical protein
VTSGAVSRRRWLAIRRRTSSDDAGGGVGTATQTGKASAGVRRSAAVMASPLRDHVSGQFVTAALLLRRGKHGGSLRGGRLGHPDAGLSVLARLVASCWLRSRLWLSP